MIDFALRKSLNTHQFNYIIMKKLFCLIVLGVSFCIAANAGDNSLKDNPASETLIVLGKSASELDSPASGEQTEYSLTLMCPNCNAIMSAKFKKGYTSTTTAKCPKCSKKYVISYNWPGDHKEPTIRSVKETK